MSAELVAACVVDPEGAPSEQYVFIFGEARLNAFSALPYNVVCVTCFDCRMSNLAKLLPEASLNSLSASGP